MLIRCTKTSGEEVLLNLNFIVSVEVINNKTVITDANDKHWSVYTSLKNLQAMIADATTAAPIYVQAGTVEKPKPKKEKAAT